MQESDQYSIPDCMPRKVARNKARKRTRKVANTWKESMPKIANDLGKRVCKKGTR